ncbi:hypothetical protein AA0472_1039 [Acetobacter estunensis NRIC 0472]|uniref:Aspartyl protease n=1 Tax=Acetobacter estunensis TaxID=104097 RepID=A0A967B7U2_9PROT|nr:retropepsin-like aspartic protease [Acetobacter estunensis]NHO54734.1 hypothetical protein [Acetobacter estunensis]GBQ23268.1 hypothetical protein AA0472_1039 [Acetobacter estunensis NRIC 0472]
MAKLGAVCVTVLLGASVAQAAPRPSCAMTRLADVPLRDDMGFLSTPGTIHGHTASFIVDTGSQGSLLSPWFARFLELSADPGAQTHVSGTGGSGGIVPNVIVPQLRLGDLSFGPLSMPLGILPSRPNIHPPIEGLLGGDVVGQDVLEFDAPDGRLGFWMSSARESAACDLAPPTVKGLRWQEIRGEMQAHRILLHVQLDGHELVALLDSGARSRIVSRRAAEAIGVTESDLATDPGGTSTGVDGRESVYRWHRFHTLAIGGETETNPVLTVAPIAEPVDMLLGSDWFATHRVWVFYRQGRIFAARVQPTGKHSGG